MIIPPSSIIVIHSCKTFQPRKRNVPAPESETAKGKELGRPLIGLLVVQGFHWVDARGAAGRYVVRDERHREKQGGDAGHYGGI